MSDKRSVDDAVLSVGDRLTFFPVIHGSGDCALEVRRFLLERRFDCIAVPLPPSFQRDVERAIDELPVPMAVIQRPTESWQTFESEADDSEDRSNDANDRDGFSLDDDELDENALDGDDGRPFGGLEIPLSYVPIDPCQPVIMALRIARQERIDRAFIDLETGQFDPYSASLPDAYALKKTSVARFAAAILPVIPRPPAGQTQARIAHMAWRLRELTSRYRSVLCVCSLLDWPWLREAYVDKAPRLAEHDTVADTETFRVAPETLHFMLGELPFITGLYERARAELNEDENLSIDGVKQLFQYARDQYRAEFKGRGRAITPLRLAQCMHYIRNLALTERRLTPDLYTLVIAAQQIVGDAFAIQVVEAARSYPYISSPLRRKSDDEAESGVEPYPQLHFGIDRVALRRQEVLPAVSRLPGPPREWRTCSLHRRPVTWERDKWQMQWNPYQQCSWPPEDELVENFRSHVFDRAKAILGADLARTEKFTTSVKDGIDIRDTLRHWYDGNIYVKVLPPSRGRLDCAVMLFDAPADPRDYPWRTTWFAEHEDESTLAFYATDFHKEMVGPGIGLANYGGALFLYPPRPILDVWSDPRLDFANTLEERLLAAACVHSRESHVALLSALPPGAGYRGLARRFGKKLVHVPLAQFSDATIQQLRMVHVLNGKQVRSYAAHFIRKA